MILLQKQNKESNNKGEQGNVLFLILIAVALFAALSYAVTQSTRTGGGNNDNETALINSAQLTQYPSSVRTAVLRMIISGVESTELEFNAPSEFDDCSSNDMCVFHPSGGGGTYAFAPAEFMASDGGNTGGEWFFSGENQVQFIGTSTTNASANDIVAYLPGITQSLCGRINEELGLGNIEPAEADPTFAQSMISTGSPPSGAPTLANGNGNMINGSTTPGELAGQPSGCFQFTGVTSGDVLNNSYVYYQVLVER